MRSNGYQAQGFATLTSTGEIEILPETKLLLEKLLAHDRLNPGQYYSEVRDSIMGYVTQWQKYILPDTGVNMLGAKSYTMLSKHDGTYQGDAGKALTDGAIGFHDYSLNWLIFHNQPMDVKFSLPTNSVGKQLQVSFLNDPQSPYFPSSNHSRIRRGRWAGGDSSQGGNICNRSDTRGSTHNMAF